MPYEPHANLVQPTDMNAYIWRFIDLPKFLDLISSDSLYFCRGDQLEDPYEGLMPDEYVAAIRNGQTNIGSVQHQIRMFHYYRSDFFVNCWHISDHESAAMWKLYAGVDAGIALKSMYGRLQMAFQESPERHYLGLANYDANSVFGTTNGFKFIMWKRKSFEHEKEVRSLIWRPDSGRGFVNTEGDTPVTLPLPSRPGATGLKIPTSVSRLVVEVVVSPTSPTWVVGVLQGIMKRYGHKIPIRQSTLNRLSYVD